MATKDLHHVSEAESMKVAEASREKEWKQPSFLREMFLGNFRLDLIHPFPFQAEERPEFTAFYRAFKEFMAGRSTRSRSTPRASTRSRSSMASASSAPSA